MDQYFDSCDLIFRCTCSPLEKSFLSSHYLVKISLSHTHAHKLLVLSLDLSPFPTLPPPTSIPHSTFSVSIIYLSISSLSTHPPIHSPSLLSSLYLSLSLSLSLSLFSLFLSLSLHSLCTCLFLSPSLLYSSASFISFRCVALSSFHPPPPPPPFFFYTQTVHWLCRCDLIAGLCYYCNVSGTTFLLLFVCTSHLQP